MRPIIRNGDFEEARNIIIPVTAVLFNGFTMTIAYPVDMHRRRRILTRY